MNVAQTSIKVACGKCGTEKTFKVSDIAEAAGPDEDHVAFRISEPCGGCDERLELEVTLELE